jgi:hypothetical protein
MMQGACDSCGVLPDSRGVLPDSRGVLPADPAGPSFTGL